MTPNSLVAPVVGGTPEQVEDLRLIVRHRLRLIRESIAIRCGETSGANAFVHREALRDIDKLVEQLHDELTAALVLRPEPRAQWLPIESAPKDEEVFFWVVPKTPEESYVDTSENTIFYTGPPQLHRGKLMSWSSLSKATHWMPLPSPPKSDAAVLPASAPSLEGNHSVRHVGNVTIACMAPEARDLLDRAMEQWREFDAKREPKPDDPAYSFAYWLFRWSGLIQIPAASARSRPLEETMRAALMKVDRFAMLAPTSDGKAEALNVSTGEREIIDADAYQWVKWVDVLRVIDDSLVLARDPQEK